MYQMYPNKPINHRECMPVQRIGLKIHSEERVSICINNMRLIYMSI